MKKKIYFIISAILQMIASIYLIISSNEMFEQTMMTIKDTQGFLPADFYGRLTTIINNIGIYYIIGPAIFCILINSIILILAFAGKIIKKRNLLIFLSILAILFSSSIVAMLLAIANLIILLSIKKDEVEAFKDKNNKLPVVKEKNYTKKELISAAAIFLVYFSHFIWGNYIPENNKLISILVTICFYTIMFLLVFVLFGEKIVDDFKKLIKNFSAYIEYDLPKYGLMIISSVIVNLICIIVTKNATSVNQNALEALPKIVLAILSVIWAPLVEETIFRGTIRRYINHKWLFVVLSGLIFGFLHATDEGTIFEIIMTTLPYASLGGWLAYIYYKTDNIANNIMIHAIWNLFAFIFSLFLSMII